MFYIIKLLDEEKLLILMFVPTKQTLDIAIQRIFQNYEIYSNTNFDLRQAAV